MNHLRPKKKTENLILPQTGNKQPEEETSKDRSADQSHFPQLVAVAGQRKWADRLTASGRSGISCREEPGVNKQAD